jgi:hypothetical protein
LLHVAPLNLLIACSGTGILGENDIATSGYCGLATAESTTWPSNLSLTAGDGVVAFQAEVERGELHVDSNGSWLLKNFPYPDAEFGSGFVFNANFDSKNDVRDETDEVGVRTVTLKAIIPFEYKGDTYEKAATFVLVSADEGDTLRVTMKDSPPHHCWTVWHRFGGRDHPRNRTCGGHWRRYRRGHGRGTASPS